MRDRSRLLTRSVNSLLLAALTLLLHSSRSHAVLPDAPNAVRARASAARALAPQVPRVMKQDAPAPQSTVPVPVRPRRVLLISEDGMHPALIKNQHLPWHEWLVQRGAYSLSARTIRKASTLPSHAAMLSGVDVNEHGLIWNSWRPQRGYIRARTVFQEATAHGLRTAAFVGKFKLRHILPEGTVQTFVRPGYYCKKVSDEAARYLETHRPDLTFVHFSDPDEAEHSAGWLSSAQLQAARECDRCLGTLIQALERAGMLHDTLIIVSADHGGHNHGHTGALVSDLEIPWIASGPTVHRGFAIPGRISTMDTAATVMHALGLAPTAALRGRPLLEIFKP